jgi:hypothetical protein
MRRLILRGVSWDRKPGKELYLAVFTFIALFLLFCCHGGGLSLFFGLCGFIPGRRPALTGGRAMVRSVESGSLKYNTYRKVDFPEGFLVALRATGERWVAKVLPAVKLHTTIFTPIGIYRHRNPSSINTANSRRWIIARRERLGKRQAHQSFINIVSTG